MLVLFIKAFGAAPKIPSEVEIAGLEPDERKENVVVVATLVFGSKRAFVVTIDVVSGFEGCVTGAVVTEAKEKFNATLVEVEGAFGTMNGVWVFPSKEKLVDASFGAPNFIADVVFVVESDVS